MLVSLNVIPSMDLHPVALALGMLVIIVLVIIVIASSHQRERLRYLAQRAIPKKHKFHKEDSQGLEKEGNLPTFAKTAAETGNLRILNRWIHSLNKNINARSDENMTALHYAARGGHAESVRALLEAGADPNCHDERRVTPLHLGALGHGLCIKLLLDNHADPFNEDIDMQTPLMIAEKGGNIGCARLLQRAMAKINNDTQNNGGLTLRYDRTHTPNNV